MRKTFCLTGVFLLINAVPLATETGEGVLRAGGYLEIGVHYSTWNVNVLEPVLVDLLVPDLDEYDESQGIYGFDSSGRNTGIALRWFPGGYSGSFSVGISWEWNFFNAVLDAEYDYTGDNGNRLLGDFQEEIELVPHSLNLNLRWELWPRSRIHPFLGIGFGFGALEGRIRVTGTAHTVYPDSTADTEDIEEEYTLKELLREEDAAGGRIPFDFFPVAQLQLGIRARIIKRLHVTGEMAFYNGISWRGGLAWRL